MEVGVFGLNLVYVVVFVIKIDNVFVVLVICVMIVLKWISMEYKWIKLSVMIKSVMVS